MSFTRQSRYQQGSISRVSRSKGPDVWVYRWRELQPDGSRLQKKKIIGTVKEFPRRSDVQREVENLRSEINAEQADIGRTTFRELWGHFQTNELRSPIADRSPTTIQCYEENLKRHILPHWGDCFIDEIKAVKVEAWLSSLPYAPATKAKLRNQMSCLYSHAIRHELWDRLNPIAPVRQSSKRQSIPDILTLAEMTAILQNLSQPVHRIAVMVAAVTGLRRSEIRGLKWRDVDFGKLWLRLERGVVRNDQTKLKTEGSRKGVPLNQDLAAALAEWRQNCLYPTDNDWVIASPTTEGESPLWLDIVMRDHIKPAAVKASITKRIGWHTFRRSLASILAAKGEHVKVVQELLRHSNSSITMELYQQAEADAKRAAQNHVNGLFLTEKAS
ncbi:tyrosine-type recombinase/integrase [Edaphobacter modestus]|uniref:Site-specific recombinase XerD n=1 Tax=Edaphobacter modestus TaxID=388466 RepID=A0A4Q7YRL4_9BACT|nr:site-specific integrase [Edaphobacter modestus]RZU40347.1 site-specific recombinase XerD [Edaphobacter modestus]